MLTPKDRDKYNAEVESELPPVYEVMADYPNNVDFPVGKIITFQRWRCSTIYWSHTIKDCKGEREFLSDFFDKYPHVFKKIKQGNSPSTPTPPGIVEQLRQSDPYDNENTKSRNVWSKCCDTMATLLSKKGEKTDTHEIIKSMAEKHADKMFKNQSFRWQHVVKVYIQAINDWIGYKIYEGLAQSEDKPPYSMPLPAQEPFNTKLSVGEKGEIKKEEGK